MTGPGRPTILLTVTGLDRPGVTSAVVGLLAAHGLDILDVEQVVIQGRIVLGALATAPPEAAGLERAAAALAESLGLEAQVSRGHGDSARRAPGRTHVTLLGAPLRAVALTAVTGRIADTGANIDRIVRIARYPVTALELEVSGADAAVLGPLLAVEAARQRVDVAVASAGLHRRAKRLVVMDVDSTLVQGEMIEMLAEHAGAGPEVARLTEAAMRGDLDFADSLRERVRLLEGVPESALQDVRRSVRLAPGARTLVRTLKRLDHRIGVVSGGFTQVVEPLAAELGIDYVAANTLEVSAGRLTGRLLGELVDRAGKAAALARFAALAGVPLSQTVAVGDGANDVDMLALAGLGVAFNAKPVVRAAADTSVSVPYLDALLYLLGISREEVEQADAAAGETPGAGTTR